MTTEVTMFGEEVGDVPVEVNVSGTVNLHRH